MKKEAADGPVIRKATQADLSAIDRIYNHYVRHSTCTYQVKPGTLAERIKWYARQGRKYPVTVAVLDGRVAGWGSLSPFREREGYRYTADDSVYVRPDLLGRGIGSLLLKDLVRRARKEKFHTVLASISGEQRPSIRLHARYGFKKAAFLRQVGRKSGKWLDVVYMQLML